MTIDTRVSKEWASRPDDERYLSLQDLHAAVRTRTDNSRSAVVNTAAIKAYGTEENELVVSTDLGPKFLTNWSFGQISQLAGAPSGYLKRLPAPLAAANLNHGLAEPVRNSALILVNGNEKLRALTSEKYGRIWDHEVVEAVQRVTEGSSWQIPASSYATTNPKRATTLYASDRDVFLFLVDPEHPIEIPGEPEPLFRGFYCWNSEVGAQVFGLATFLYQRVCDNRIIWGVAHRAEIRIRHSAGAPARFLSEGRQALIEYTDESAQPIVDRIKRAQAAKLGDNEDEVRDFLRKRGLTLAQADSALDLTKQEGKDPLNAWAVTEGITAAARSVAHTDARLQVEKIAGGILESVSA